MQVRSVYIKAISNCMLIVSNPHAVSKRSMRRFTPCLKCQQSLGQAFLWRTMAHFIYAAFRMIVCSPVMQRLFPLWRLFVWKETGLENRQKLSHLCSPVTSWPTAYSGLSATAQTLPDLTSHTPTKNAHLTPSTTKVVSCFGRPVQIKVPKGFLLQKNAPKKLWLIKTPGWFNLICRSGHLFRRLWVFNATSCNNRGFNATSVAFLHFSTFLSPEKSIEP